MPKKTGYCTLAGLLFFVFLTLPFAQTRALTYGEVVNQGNVLGASTANVYPYPTGTLVNDGGTIYFIYGSTKVPFTNWQTFLGLGYFPKTVVTGDTSSYSLVPGYTLSTTSTAHPWGSWLIYKGTVYYATQTGLIGVPSASVFASNGGIWKYVIQANAYDVAALNANPGLPVLTSNDPRVIVAPTSSNPATPTPTPTPVVTPTTPAVSPFTDVSTIDPSYASIVQVLNAGIMVGYGNGLFGPTDPLTREQAAITIVKRFNLSLDNLPTTATFADVPMTDPNWKYVESIYRAGITAGCSASPKDFCPTQPATRAQYAVFLVAGLGLNPATAPQTPYFTDVASSNPAFPYIQLMYQKGLTAGCSANPLQFCPNAPLTRADAADFLASSLNVSMNTNVPATSTPSTVVGQLVNVNGTIDYVAQNGLYGFPSAAIFESWGYTFNEVVAANSTEAALPVLGNVPAYTVGCASVASAISGSCGSTTNPVSAGTSTSFTVAQNAAFVPASLQFGSANQRIASFTMTAPPTESVNFSTLFLEPQPTGGLAGTSNFQNLYVTVNGTQFGQTYANVDAATTLIFTAGSPFVLGANQQSTVDVYADVPVWPTTTTPIRSLNPGVTFVSCTGTGLADSASVGCNSVIGQALSFYSTNTSPTTPTVSSITPATAAAGHTVNLVIIGSGFLSTANESGNALPITSVLQLQTSRAVSDNEIDATYSIPASAPSGIYQFGVGGSNTVPFTITAAGSNTPPTTFSDVPAGSHYYNAVTTVATEGVMNGYANGLFGPNDNMTREQAAVAVVSLFKIPMVNLPATPSFADVSATDPAWKFVEALYQAKVTAGCSAAPLDFCPTQPITRGQFAVFLVAAWKLNTATAPATPYFNDVPSTSGFFPFIQLLYQKGIVAGTSVNPPLFSPNSPLLRGDAAVMLAGITP